MSTAGELISILFAAIVLAVSCGNQSGQTPSTSLPAHTPSPSSSLSWPDALAGEWRVIEWFPARIGTWTYEEGGPLVGQIARLYANDLEVPGYACERPHFAVSDTGEFWEQFEKCQTNQPPVGCRDIGWAGDSMLECAGPENRPTPLAQVGVSCPDGEGLGLDVAQLSDAQAFLSLSDGRGFLCVELME